MARVGEDGSGSLWLLLKGKRGAEHPAGAKGVTGLGARAKQEGQSWPDLLNLAPGFSARGFKNLLWPPPVSQAAVLSRA